MLGWEQCYLSMEGGKSKTEGSKVEAALRVSQKSLNISKEVKRALAPGVWVAGFLAGSQGLGGRSSHVGCFVVAVPC